MGEREKEREKERRGRRPTTLLFAHRCQNPKSLNANDENGKLKNKKREGCGILRTIRSTM